MNINTIPCHTYSCGLEIGSCTGASFCGLSIPFDLAICKNAATPPDECTSSSNSPAIRSFSSSLPSSSPSLSMFGLVSSSSSSLCLMSFSSSSSSAVSLRSYLDSIRFNVRADWIWMQFLILSLSLLYMYEKWNITSMHAQSLAVIERDISDSPAWWQAGWPDPSRVNECWWLKIHQ